MSLEVIMPEDLVKDVLSGDYVPSTLEGCESVLPIDRNPHVVRFSDFILLKNPEQENTTKEPEYRILQLYTLSKTKVDKNKKRDMIKDHLVKPLAEALATDLELVEDLITGKLPKPGTIDVDTTRKIVLDRLAHTSSYEIDPSMIRNMDERKRDTLYKTWLTQQKNIGLLSMVEHLQKAGFDLIVPVKDIKDMKDRVDVLSDILTDVFLPPEYQPFRSPYPHFALHVTFEQIWQPIGYTRGELITSISLVPGEQLTLEIHSWDKSTIKSEEELATESELRVAERLTQRDALAVTRQVAAQFGSSLSAGVTVPIEDVPVNLSGNVSGQVNASVSETLDRTREYTAEASNTLKTSRKMRIEISREVGRESKQTRVIANTNRCHTLNCQYFEVMSNYLVTTRFVSAELSLLLPNPKVKVNPEWVLCHEDILKQVLLDKAFLAGFDGARVLETHERFLRLKKEEAKAKGEVAEELQDPLKMSVKAIVDAYDDLQNSKDKVKDAKNSGECRLAKTTGGSLGLATCVFVKTGHTIFSRVLYLAMLRGNEPAFNALIKLTKDYNSVDKGEMKASEALRNFFAAVTPRDYQFNVYAATLAKGLDELGIPYDLVTALVQGGYIDLYAEDAGLYNAVKAAADKLEEIWELPGETEKEAVQEGYSKMEIAQAEVSFEQLKCHIEENWLHYLQQVWSREDADQRFLRLQTYGAAATIIRNDLVGFYGHKSAYPINDLQTINEWTDYDFETLITKIKEKWEQDNPKTQLVTLPTPGVVLEAMVGKCDACEDFIQKSREYDKRTQEAKARQEEAEAKRREMKLAQVPPDLSTNLPADGKVIINVDGEETEPSG